MATSPSSAAYSLLYLYSPVRHSYEGSINARMEKGNGPPLQCPGTHLCPQLLGVGERVPHCVVTAPHGRACHSRWISCWAALTRTTAPYATDQRFSAFSTDTRLTSTHTLYLAPVLCSDDSKFSRTWCCTAASHEDERPPVFADISVAFRVRAGRRPRPTRRSARPTPCPSSTSSSGSPDPRTPSRPHGGCTVTVQCHRREAHVGARKRRWVIEAIRRLRRAIAGTLAWREDRGAGRDPCGAGVGRERHEEKGAGAPLPLPQPDAWGIRGGGPGGVAARSFAPAHIVDDVRSFSPTARKQVKPRGDVFRLAHTTRALVVENTTHLLKRLLMADRCVSSSPYAPRTRTGAVAQDPSVRARAHLLALQGRLRNRVQQYRANHEALWMFRANAPLAEPLEAAKSTPSSTWRAQSRSTHIARACASSPLIPREDPDLNDTALAEALNAPSPPAALRPHPHSFSTFVPREADAIDMRPRASPRPWSARARAAAPCTSQLRLLAGSTLRGRCHRAHRARSRSTHTSRAKKLAEMTTGSFADVFVDLALAEPLDAAFRPRCSPPGRLLAGDIVRGRRRGYGAREPLDATVAHSALGPPPSARPSSQFLAAGTVRARHRCGCGIHGAPVACAALRPHSTSLPVRAGPTPSYTSGLAVSARHHRARRPSHARFLAGGTAGGRGPRGYDAWQAPVGGVHALAEPLDAGAAACRAVHERVVAPHIFGDPSSGALGAAAYGARRPVCIRRAGDDAELVLEGCFSRSRPPSVRALSGPLAAGACATLRRFNT
ncbi:hypothetical protein DFH09DRAFT_1320735 [Mycena vulgaris]|nr:hypothetical protein DFH09DRAFT_1320735 [Mycena vulgaris]